MKINIERVLLVAMLLLSIFNAVLLVKEAKEEISRPIEEKEGFFIEETPDFSTMKLIEMEEL